MPSSESPQAPPNAPSSPSDRANKAKILRQLRQSLAPQIGLDSAPPPMAESVERLSADDGEDFSEDLQMLRQRANIYHVPLLSSRRFGKLLTSARKLTRKILKPILMFQVGYNSANVRVVEALTAQVGQLRQERDRLDRALNDRDDTIATMQAAIAELQQQQRIQTKALQKLVRSQTQTQTKQRCDPAPSHGETSAVLGSPQVEQLANPKGARERAPRENRS